MMREIAKLHIEALPDTLSSRIGMRFVEVLYLIVEKLGFIHTVRREDKIVGVMSGIGKWILTLVVDPSWQHKGIGSELVGRIKDKCYVYTQEGTIKFYEKMKFRKLLKMGKTVVLCRE